MSKGVTIRICTETYETLSKLKEEVGIPMTEAIRVAVREKYVKTKEE